MTKKNPRTSTEKLIFKKYDPVLRKHVEFKESQDQIAAEDAGAGRNLKPGPSCEWQTLAQQNGRAWLVQREFKTSKG